MILVNVLPDRPRRPRQWAHRDRPDGKRECTRCHDEKPVDEFYKSNGKPQAYCKPCFAEMGRGYRAGRTAAEKAAASERRRKDYEDGWPLRVWHRLKARAKESGLPFDIEPADLVLPARCPVLGIPLVVARGLAKPNSPSVDRIRADLGYVKGNIAVISIRANAIKNDATIEDLDAVLRWLKGMV